MTITKRLKEINYNVDRKYILNSSALRDYKETLKYNKIEIVNGFINSKLIIDLDSNTSVDIEKLIFYATKDFPYSKIIIDNIHDDTDTLFINILPLLTTA